MSFSFKSLESGALTLLEALVGIVAPLAAAKNPAYAPVITAASGAIQTELGNIAAGNTPTLHDQSIATIVTASIAGAAVAVAKNNPTDAALVGNVAQAAAGAATATLAGS